MSSSKKIKTSSDTCEKLRFYPGWLAGNEEEFLCRMAEKGWMLKSIRGDTVYRFEKTAPAKKIFAVEFLGKRPSVAEEIAEDCNAGWDYLGKTAKKRYYCCDASSLAISHPSADSEAEQSRLSTTMTNLTTLLLLNIPGTLYCLLYCILLLATNGLSLAASLSYHYIYFFGSLFGLFSIYLLFRWILAAKHRNKSIGGTGGVL